MKPPPSTLVRKPPPEPSEDMTEELRAQVDTIVVSATRDPADEAVSGSYEKGTFGLVGGVVAGHEVGRIRKEVGPVPVEFRIPGTAIPGAIIGGLFGGMQHEVQQLRDALAEELVDAESTPLTDDGLAMDVYSRLRRVLESSSRIVAPTTPIPENTDAVLHVKFGGVSIDVQGRDAVRCRWSSHVANTGGPCAHPGASAASFATVAGCAFRRRPRMPTKAKATSRRGRTG